jgi:UDP-N-acetylmuramate--alanine ligase
MAVLCVDDPHVAAILPRITKPITTYGFSEHAQVRAVDARFDGGKMRFTVLREDQPPLAVALNQPGMHNVLNALSAIAVATEVGADDAAIVAALDQFHGVGRRFTRLGEWPTADGGHYALIDDYGHHPVEMAATLAAARGAYPGRRLVLTFQPHRYTRTRDCFEDFVRVLGDADVVVLTEVYPAGEAPLVAADGRALARALRVAGRVEPVFVEAVADLPGALHALLRDGDVVLVMGAGSIGQTAQRLVEGDDVA